MKNRWRFIICLDVLKIFNSLEAASGHLNVYKCHKVWNIIRLFSNTSSGILHDISLKMSHKIIDIQRNIDGNISILFDSTVSVDGIHGTFNC